MHLPAAASAEAAAVTRAVADAWEAVAAVAAAATWCTLPPLLLPQLTGEGVETAGEGAPLPPPAALL